MLRRSAISVAVKVENAASFEVSAESSCIAAAAGTVGCVVICSQHRIAGLVNQGDGSLVEGPRRVHGKQGMYAVGMQAPVQTCGLSCVVQRLCQRCNVSTRQQQWDHFAGDECLNRFTVDAEACHGCSLAVILQQRNLICQFQNNGINDKVERGFALTECYQVAKRQYSFSFTHQEAFHLRFKLLQSR